MPLRRIGEAGDILRRKAHPPQHQGEGGSVVLAHPHPVLQGADGPLLQKGDRLLSPAVYPPRLFGQSCCQRRPWPSGNRSCRGAKEPIPAPPPAPGHRGGVLLPEAALPGAGRALGPGQAGPPVSWGKRWRGRFPPPRGRSTPPPKPPPEGRKAVSFSWCVHSLLFQYKRWTALQGKKRFVNKMLRIFCQGWPVSGIYNKRRASEDFL